MASERPHVVDVAGGIDAKVKLAGRTGRSEEMRMMIKLHARGDFVCACALAGQWPHTPSEII